ncbi:MAG: thioredoxin domain-containing protein [Actinomycetales bacterium]|jgi:protein-disulfide isomerase|nr:thioredoxin domain-containing protein [Actinomycetales bacterium]
MSPTDRPTKAQRREAAREEARRLREEQERAAKRRRLFAIGGAAVVLVGFVVLVVAILTSGRTPAAAKNQPPFAVEGGGVVLDADGVVTPPEEPGEDWPVGAFGDTVVVTVYSDMICPACGLFEMTAGQVLEEMREAGEVVLDHRIVGNLDGFSQGTRYSTRAAQALYTVAEEAPDAFPAFLSALFANQPAEGTRGLTDEQIIEIARAAGVPEEAAAAIEEGRYTWWVEQITQVARERFAPRFGTPTVLLNGTPLPDDVDWRDEQALRASIEAARG